MSHVLDKNYKQKTFFWIIVYEKQILKITSAKSDSLSRRDFVCYSLGNIAAATENVL